MMHRATSILFAVIAATAACGTAPPPRSAPSPVRTDTADARRTMAVAATKPDTQPAPAAKGVATPEVASEAVRIFGDSTPPKPSADSASGPAAPTWDIDVRSYETRDRVQFWVNRFSHDARALFTQWLNRGHRYDAIIRPRLKAAGLPEDLTYLALIESGYDPNAYSRAAAVGMWQLMTSTARDAGLRVDWWVDERRDPVKSTDAAARFLKWLNGEFGSLYLAAAAYDGGPGRISRGLTRYADDLVGTEKEDAFFVLADKDYLRHETKEYVPQLIAAALIAKEPQRYGIEPNYLPPLAFDSVRVGPATPLAAIAKATGVTVADIRELNPFVLRGMTPPRDSFTVRVPVGSGATLNDALAALPAEQRTAFTRTTVKKGETMAALERRTGLTRKQLGWYNRNLSPNKKGKLPVGEEVIVPSEAVVAAAVDVPDPAIEKYGSSSRTKTVTHVVKRGETLASIAKKFGTTTAALKKLNGLESSTIRPGLSLVVKRSTTRGKPSKHSSSSKKKSSSKKHSK